MENQIQTNDFLPNDYKVPDKSKQFMKLKQGDNVIRVLLSPALGYVVFSTEKMPHRKNFTLGDFSPEELKQIGPKVDELTKEVESPKHFWMLAVWDYTDKVPKVLEITQISVIRALYQLSQDADWGDLRGFDINLHKEGSTKNDTTYTVTPKPPKPLTKEVSAVFEELQKKEVLNLDAIWEGKYPFALYDY